MTSIDRRYGVAEGLAVKAPCRVASIATVTLNGLQTIDGVVLAEGDRVLVKDQADHTLNGIYKASSGNWTRDLDFDGTLDVVQYTRVFAGGGTTQDAREYYVTTANPVIGSAIVFAPGPDLVDPTVLDTIASLYATRASVTGAIIPAASQWLITMGYATAGDGGQGRYVRVASQPAHNGKVRSLDRFLPNGTIDLVNGGWWKLADSQPHPLQFGAVCDGTDTMDPSYWQSDWLAHTKGDWVTATNYVLNDLVWDASTLVGGFAKRVGYRCISAHTSGVFLTDLAAGKWVAGAFAGTDNSQAFKDWFAYCKAETSAKGRIVSNGTGKFRLGDAIAALNVYNAIDYLIDLGANGCEITGEGREGVTLLIDEDVSWAVNNSYNRSTHAIFGTADEADFNSTARPAYRFRGIGLRGRWMHFPGGNNGSDTPNWIGPMAFGVRGSRELSVIDCKTTDIRNAAMRNYYLASAVVRGNRFERCARGFVKLRTSGRFDVSDNVMLWGDDDCIDVQTQDSALYNNNRAYEGGLIEGNYVFNGESMLIGVARNLTVRGNHMVLCHSGAAMLAVGSLVTGFQDQAALDVSIVDNTIMDPVKRWDGPSAALLTASTAVDGAISFQTAGRTIVVSDSTNPHGVYPGDYDATGTVFLSEETGNRAHTMDVTALRSGPAGRGLIISGNKVLRSLPSDTFGNWGFGLLFYQGGFINPVYADANWLANGIILLNDTFGASITGNNLEGLPGQGVRLRGQASTKRIDAFQNVVIAHNTIRKMLTGVAKDFAGGNIDHWGVKVFANEFDLDPLHTNSLRTAGTPSGKWQARSTSDPTGVGVFMYQNKGGSIAYNGFRNLHTPVELNTGGAFIRDNTLFGQPVNFGYDANNKGIGNWPATAGYTLITRDSTPGSGTYGQCTDSPVEFTTGSLASGSAISIAATGNVVNVITLSLPGPGIYEVGGIVGFVITGTGMKAVQAGISSTTAAIPGANDNSQSVACLPLSTAGIGVDINPTIALTPCRISVLVATSVFLVAKATFVSGTVNAYGRIYAKLIA